ncbi:hypothetical protein IPL85_05355 [Candidatus Saccharibacteria bacterium]|nr:MAG: hypothetical protein IPL85_05355 [Candidatus Saccharibacteria bacterium]
MATIETDAFDEIARLSLPSVLLTRFVFQAGSFDGFSAVPLLPASQRSAILNDDVYTPTGVFEMRATETKPNQVVVAVNCATLGDKQAFLDDIRNATKPYVPVGEFKVDFGALALACSRRRIPLIGSVTQLESDKNKFGMLLVPNNFATGAERPHSLEIATLANEYIDSLFAERIEGDDAKADVGAQILTASFLYWALGQTGATAN